MNTILQLIESELHKRAVLKIKEEKKRVAAEAFDVPELREEEDNAVCAKCGKCEVGKEGDVCSECTEEVSEEDSKDIQSKNVQGKRHSVAINLGASEEEK